MLLNFTQCQSSADGVDRSGGNKEGIPGRCVEPLEQVFYLAGKRRFAQTMGGDGLAETCGDLSAGFRGEDVPHLGFS
jgi:hypothetical protein